MTLMAPAPGNGSARAQAARECTADMACTVGTSLAVLNTVFVQPVN